MGHDLIPGMAGAQPFQLLQIFNKYFGKALFNVGILIHFRHGVPEFLNRTIQEQVEFLNQICAPDGFRGILGVGQFQSMGCLLNPAVHIRTTSHLLMGHFNGIRQPSVIPSIAKGFGHGQKVRICFGVTLFQQAFQHQILQNPAFRFLGNTEICRYIQQMGIGSQQSGTERMYCGNFSQINPVKLSLQMPVFRILRQPLTQCLGDFPPKLCRCRFGIGNDKEIIDIAGILRITDLLQQTIHKNLGFSGSGGRRYQQRSAPVIHHGLLCRCQFHFSHGFPPLPVFSKTV